MVLRAKFKLNSQSEKMINDLKVILTKKQFASAAGSGADVIRDFAEVEAPVGPNRPDIGRVGGNLAGSLVSRIDLRKRLPTGFAHAEYAKKGFHAHLVEFGTRLNRWPTLKRKGKIKPGGTWVWNGITIGPKTGYTGKMPANPFMKRAGKKGEAFAKQRVTIAIDKMINKKFKKYGSSV